MTLNNIKQLRKDRGFTIVELLIVIIVIAILAAIVIVAYQGITAKANASKAQTNAVSVQKKVEAFAADSSNGNGQYPATAVGTATAPPTSYDKGTGVAAPVTGVSVIAADPTSSNATTAVRYTSCTVSGNVTGYYIDYYDTSQSKLVYIVGGTGITAGANNTTAPTTTGCTSVSTT